MKRAAFSLASIGISSYNAIAVGNTLLSRPIAGASWATRWPPADGQVTNGGPDRDRGSPPEAGWLYLETRRVLTRDADDARRRLDRGAGSPPNLAGRIRVSRRVLALPEMHARWLPSHQSPRRSLTTAW
jgi:hypothetical protein